MSRYKLFLLFIIATLSIAKSDYCYSQQEQKWFGQNKVQYQHYDWNFIQSEHFDIYFHKGGDRIARFAAEVAESSLVAIKADYREYEIQNRISIILYNSHNQFQQNNVIDEYMPEGVGGVTELFKNRIVLPYEGSYEQFRHVIHHELTHGVMNDFMYGGSMQSLITGRIRIQIPLWFAEGYAEYSSRYNQFNTQADMFVRDAVIEGYLPKLDQIDGYASYVVGPTVFRFIEERYGKEKVAEFITKLRVSGTVNSTIESSFGMKIEEFSDKWALHQRKIYYPDIAGMQSVKEIAKQLTKHDIDGNFYNYTPTLSPNGDQIAYLSDRDGYADIFLTSAVDGKIIKKIVSGEKTPDLEELHWLSPGMSWSPDGKKIVISAKASDNDAIFVIDVMTGDIEKFKWNDLEGVFGGSFSPDGKSITFTGMRFGQSDIYIYNIETKLRIKLTDDIFSDSKPSFSPDGKKIAFVSDRGLSDVPKGRIKKAEYDYSQTDIFIINTDGSGLERVTTDPMNDDWPQWSSDQTKLIFTSDRNGVSNLYVADLQTKNNYAITNNLSGIFQPSLSRDGLLVAFTGFNKSGFDIFTMKRPFEQKPIDLALTVSMKKFRKEKDLSESLKDQYFSESDTAKTDRSGGITFSGGDTTVTDSSKNKLQSDMSFRNYIFSDYGNDTTGTKDEVEPVKLTKDRYLNSEGDYRIRKYKVKFTPDIFYGAAGFNTLTGFEGTTQLAFSDILGNHRMLFGTNLFFDLKNSSFSGAYYYLSNRTDYGIMAFHTGYSFLTDYIAVEPDAIYPGSDGYADSWVRFRYYGASVSASRPFNKFNRIDVGLTQLTLSRETELTNELKTFLNKDTIPGLGPNRQSNNTIITTALITDNSLFTIFGPFDGRRAQIELTMSPGLQKNALNFTTITADYRKYFWFKKFYAVATRVSAGATFGKNPQRFFVGGMDNWIAPSFTNGDILVDTFEDFLATFVTPVRGSYYYELQGTRYAIANLEFRFPLIYYLQAGFPLPVFLQQIRGVTFLDVAAAWGGPDYDFRDRNGRLLGRGNYRYYDKSGNIIYNKGKFNWTKQLNNGETVFQDIRMGYGFGIRGFIGFFVLRYDLAWNIASPRFTGGDAKHYFSIGYDY